MGIEDSKIDRSVVSLTKQWICKSIVLALTSFISSWLTWVARFKYLSKYTAKYFTWWETISYHTFLIWDQCQKLEL